MFLLNRPGFCIAAIALLILACGAAGCTSSPAAPATPAPAVPASPAPAVPAAPVASPAAAPAGSAITIRNFAFDPATITVKTGTAVTWTNRDSVPHALASDAGATAPFSSDPIATGSSYSFTFTAPGTYAYHCSIHPSMTGTVVVQ